MLKRIINHLVLRSNDVVILDMEAGLEHLGRGTTEGMDQFVVVIEPGARSIQTYKNVKRLASGPGSKESPGCSQQGSGMRRMKNLSVQGFRQRIFWDLSIIIRK